MRPWFDGLRRLRSAFPAVIGVYLLTLLMALPLALTLRDTLQDHLGSSLAANDAADAVNYDWWQEFSGQASGLGTTFTPSIIGFATTLDSFPIWAVRTRWARMSRCAVRACDTAAGMRAPTIATTSAIPSQVARLEIRGGSASRRPIATPASAMTTAAGSNM
jgi:hypothetical protein